MHASDATNGAARLEHVRLVLEVEIPSDVQYIEQIVDLVKGQVEALRYAPRQVALNVPVALSEAISNAILRGNNENIAKLVRVRSSADPSCLIVEVTDEGKGFDLELCTPDPTTPENLSREDGRGLFLMRKLMDRVERFGEAGNVIRMTLHRQ